MRKIALLLTICIMLSLAACGRSEADMPLQENDMDEYTQTSEESEAPVELEEILPEESLDPQLPEVNFEKITEFTKDGDRVNAKIILDKPVSAENIKMYVVYKENDALKRVETVNVNDDLTAEFTIPNELKNAEISVYVWNNTMKPYMPIQKVTTEQSSLF